MSKLCQEVEPRRVSVERSFGKKLKDLRLKAKLTQEQLAEKAGLEYKYIQMLEGKTPPSPTLRTLAKIAQALEIPMQRLIPEEETKRLKAAEKK